MFGKTKKGVNLPGQSLLLGIIIRSIKNKLDLRLCINYNYINPILELKINLGAHPPTPFLPF